jgi:hypothetical protein
VFEANAIHTETGPVGAPGRRLPLLLEAALAVAGLVVLGSYALLALTHRADRYQANWVSGTYAALALRCNQGELYPALDDGQHYGGTRYMPLPFLLHAGLARLTGEYLASGKLLTYGLAVLLFGQLFLILRGLGCGPGASLALVSIVPASDPGFLACTTIRGDLLPVVLQLAALMVARGRKTSGAAVAAGLFCALALLSKLTAAWAPLAILCAYWSRRRLLAVFLATWLGTLALALGALHAASAGRMLDNFAALSVAGVGVRGLLLAPVVFLFRLGRAGVVTGLLVPALAVACARAARGGGTFYHAALLFCLAMLLAVFADLGADYNHLVDLVILAVPVLGHLWAGLPRVGSAFGGLRPVAVLGLGWVLFMAWADNMECGVRQALLGGQGPSARHPAKPLAGLVGDEGGILSEDPWVVVTRGQTPSLLDPFAFARLAGSRPRLAGDLARRVRAGEFAWVVLLQPLDHADPRDWNAWQDRRLGRAVVRAIRARYRLRAEAEGYYVYVPKPLAEP